MKSERVGIIDIGSNSVRLVVYERIGAEAFRVIDESKESVRLSARISGDGSIAPEDAERLARVLNEFRLLCRVHGVGPIRAVATAAIRNAANGRDVAALLEKRTGLSVDILSGEEEARFGFVGMINSLDIADGFLIDIGGGSTEVSLFRSRTLVRTVSFPFGAVNTAKSLADGGDASKDGVKRIRDMVTSAAAVEPWIAQHPGLPLVGLGGTIRSLCKIDQKKKKYAFPQTHRYELSQADLNGLADWLPSLPVEQRKKVDGLSDDRADIIVPGLIILHTLFLHMNARSCIVSGAGLRDGVFYETAFPGRPVRADVLGDSVSNLLSLHPAVSRPHVEHVRRLADRLFEGLALEAVYGRRSRELLRTAAMLYRIGVTVDFYRYNKHTFYLLANSRIDGLTHRESVLCALIASYKSRSRTRSSFAPYKELMEEADLDLACRLGSLLQLAVALDRSETQPLEDVRARVDKADLRIEWRSRHDPAIELRETERVAGEFKKVWGLRVKMSPATSSK
ncbi:Ppx/GppA phosphatase family protein [Paenibacillus flagellatus]|uniref:Ppx/GppA family phosphatase n=1 Tax=Paenibacillus flagellatus TaxID=2211139 RepID=A0A2V5KBV4_9BACL|nr:Ppx/GppA phosphatase family protein [Paenibacillus flagellatus]PYI57059.1 Ppx/GppA family phosphatase [Paenibacillus flagellatus]